MKLYSFDIRNFTDELFLSAYNTLPDDKKMSVDRCKVDKVKKLRTAGDMLLKKAMTEKGVADFEIYKNSKGKPYIKNSPYYFNVSHSEDIAICGISESEIGVDIEKVRKVNLKTATRFATEKELFYIFGKSPCDDDYYSDTTEIYERFFEIWTLKEAYFKKLGLGISTDLKSVEFLVENDDVTCNKDARMTIDKSIEGYIISLAE
ncbi:MAG: 4'-phosphopantetheinyl transferase superfamily protein [Clostridia bacterium]|nr:4'-phosphopantetheinyl transferase superfamily protein [Clostridia bacterium]